MSNNIYQMLNQVETDFTEYEETPLTAIDVKRMQNKIRKSLRKKRSYKGIAAAACVVCCGALLVAGPLKGEAKAAVAAFRHSIGNMLGLKTDLAPYEQVVGKTVTKDGITLTLNSVVLDGSQLTISYLENRENGFDEMGFMTASVVLVNGKEVMSGSSGYGTSIDENSMDNVVTYELEEIDATKPVDVELVFSSEENEEAKWEFAFTAKGEQLIADTLTAPMNQSVILPDGAVITLNKFTSNVMGEKIYFTAENFDNAYDMVLRGTDNLGNDMEFYYSKGTKEGGRFNIDNGMGNLSTEATELTLTLYAAALLEGAEATISLGRAAETEVADKERVETSPVGVEYQPVGEAFTVRIR